MRTAGSELPPICTSPTPHLGQALRQDGVGQVVQLALGSTSEVSDSTMIGAWDGLIFL
jgi:hypothetical protein